MMNGSGLMAGMGWPGVLLMLLLWGGAIALVLWGVSNLFPTEHVHAEDEALEIVRQRFARGEISREEFLQASETLRPGDLTGHEHRTVHTRG